MCQFLDRLESVFENDDFIVVNKPAGLNFHSENAPGLVVLCQQKFNLASLFPVHRLDKMTSGLVVLAKRKAIAQQFSQLFNQRALQKFYLAISMQTPNKKQGWVKGDMLPARRGSWKLAKTCEHPAITQFISQSIQPKERAFLLKLHTGKTHQIRVALKSLAAPIAGDVRYQQADLAKQEDRGYLHAYALKFELNEEAFEFVLPPNSGQRFLSQPFEAVLQKWSSPWLLFK